jgi:uncharacterized repeat protein (TIGR03803 family)
MNAPLECFRGCSRIWRIGECGLVSVILALLFGATIPVLVEAQTFSVLYSFTGGADGGSPQAGLIEDANGNLYGTAIQGGNQGCPGGGCGVVFKVTPSGSESVIHAFSESDGSSPEGGLFRGLNGNLYGTTTGGGDLNCDNGFGCGTVFMVDPTGRFSVLHSFAGGNDGVSPQATLVEDEKGNLYGTTFYGGPFDAGTIFEIKASGKETVLYGFTGATDGANPYSNLVIGPGNSLFGTTTAGGAHVGGVVFELTRSGLTVLHSFDGTDGQFPKSLIGVPGTLYGATVYGGPPNCDCGTVYQVTATGETVLHSFTGTDGDYPEAGPVRDHLGNLYGTTLEGGTNGCGVIFKLDTSGSLTDLYNFTCGADGGLPRAGLLLDREGNFYGTTTIYGSSGSGTVFKLAP